ncbi:serine hydrolase domain-containing protein [Chitinophaga rhizosphaerae]|uniref:serine hydrolase domain-containing protein n=1 Tax=Chitinophaga rhizosphaerae TaxID=1864947 RepID=UPI000F80E319|nr:serine hydrolase domain-containing protein [Chitinophaga rhizosphaerae]
MMRFVLISLLCLPALAAFCQKSGNPMQSPLDRKVDSLVRAAFARGECVGLMVGVIDGKKSHVYAYGETATGNGKLPTGQTLFQIGSLSKTFTGILLAAQIVRGEVKADDPISKYLPDTVRMNWFEGQPVTMLMLTNHTSAMPRWEPVMKYPNFDMKQPYRHFQLPQLYDFLNKYTPAAAPGKRYDYSNIAVGLLGELLGRNKGIGYGELLYQGILRPLKMRKTRLTASPVASRTMASGYTKEKKIQGPWVMSAVAAAGGIESNMDDMLKYARANINPGKGELGDAIRLSHQQTFAGSNAIIGMGWHISRVPGHTIVQHGGQTGGYNAYIGVEPATRKAVIVLSNVAADNQVGWPLQMYLTR